MFDKDSDKTCSDPNCATMNVLCVCVCVCVCADNLREYFHKHVHALFMYVYSREPGMFHAHIRGVAELV